MHAVVSSVVNRFYEVTNGSTYTGFCFSITIDHIEFQVRNYDDMPRATVVTSPKTARKIPEARQLVDFLTAELRRHHFYFYDEQSDIYRIVEMNSLEFAPECGVQWLPGFE